MAAQAAADKAKALALQAAAAGATGPADPCKNVPCKNGGSCTSVTSTTTGFKCSCLPGWGADDCSTSLSEDLPSAEVLHRDEVRVTRLENIYNSALGTPRYGGMGSSTAWWAPYSDGDAAFESAAELKAKVDKDGKTLVINAADAARTKLLADIHAGRASSNSEEADKIAASVVAQTTKPAAPPTASQTEQKTFDSEEKPQILALISAT